MVDSGLTEDSEQLTVIPKKGSSWKIVGDLSVPAAL
jgi:hypothetical protein